MGARLGSPQDPQRDANPTLARVNRAPHSLAGVTSVLQRFHTWPRHRRVLIAGAIAFVVAWLAIGGYGIYAEGRDYYTYRGFPPPAIPAGIAAGKVVTGHLYSPALGQRRSYEIYLPPGYRQAVARGVRYPVLYLLHAPPGKPAGFFTAGALAVRMDEMIAKHRIRPFLVALPDGRTGGSSNDTEWANANQGRYESFVLDVVHAVDQRWATVRSRSARAIGGLSEGGYGAANITLHNLGTFGAFQSWSGYFVQTPTDAFTGATAAALRANSPLLYVNRLRGAIGRLPVHAWLYQGRQDQDSNAPQMFAFARALRVAGGRVRVELVPGGHSWLVWRSELPTALLLASIWFGQGHVR